MVNIDTVYQKVLAFANKEQKGYITPQEFNILADKAQKEIYDSYFHEYKNADSKPKVNLSHGDDLNLLDEKLSFFSVNTIAIYPGATVGTVTYANGINWTQGGITTPANLYRVKVVSIPATDEVGITNPYPNATNPGRDLVFEQTTEREWRRCQRHPLTQSSINRPVWYWADGHASLVIPQGGSLNSVGLVSYYLDYYREATTPKWGYVVVDGKALYNNNTTFTTHFELHPSEEEILVAKILAYAGVVINRSDLMQAGGGIEQAIQTSKND